MADDDSGSKTEQPTQKKIDDAKEKGQSAQSKELTAIAAIIVVVAVLGSSYKFNLSLLSTNATAIFGNFLIPQDRQDIAISFFWNAFAIILKISLFPICLASIFSLLVSIGQLGGITINKEGLKFDITKLNVVTNFKNTYSKKNFIKFVRQFIEIFIMAVVAFFICRRELSDILLLPYTSLPNIINLLCLIFFKIFVILFSLHIVFSLVDLILEKMNLKKQLMMSLHDIKEEQKETDGNPEIKQKRRELHQELLEGDPFGDFAGSGILFANPTHIAIFVIFIPNKLKLPAIILIETDEKALALIKKATAAGIPVVRDVWLTRKLYELGKINSYIPASILKYVADEFSKNIKLLPNVINAIRSLKVPAQSVPRQS